MAVAAAVAVDAEYGEMRERSNRAVSKTVEPLAAPWVRIPLSPRDVRAMRGPGSPSAIRGSGDLGPSVALGRALVLPCTRPTLGRPWPWVERLCFRARARPWAVRGPGSPPAIRGCGDPAPSVVHGEMTEWPKVHAWKACVLVRVPWVRIPLSPLAPLALMPRSYAMSCCLTPSGPEGSSGKQRVHEPYMAWAELKGFSMSGTHGV
jgi:hypothetical protein